MGIHGTVVVCSSCAVHGIIRVDACNALNLLCCATLLIGAYQLELSRREERLIVKTLAQLATAEPGDNLPFVQFRYCVLCTLFDMYGPIPVNRLCLKAG
jgi:hypothetical protein